MEYVIGILLLAAFFGLVVYAVRGGNLMMGMLIMAVVWTALPLIGNALVTNPAFIESGAGVVDLTLTEALNKVFQSGPEGWGSVLVNVMFGAWFGRVLLETGIASTLIRKTVELGGDRPAVICILLSIVTTAIFSTLFGAGAVVAIGVIILPILMSLGIPKVLAEVSFMMSVGAGMYLNPVLTGQFQAFFLDAEGKQQVTYESNVTFGLIGLGVQLAVVILMILFTLRPKRVVHAWATTKSRKELHRDNAPGIALITPIIPVVLLIAFNVPIILGFTIGSFYALWVCGRLSSWRATCRVVNKDYFDGVVDTAPLIGFLLVLPMFNKSAELCAPYFKALLGGFIPDSTLVIGIAFAILAPLALFRGPLTLFGCGAAVLGILNGFGFPVHWLFCLLVIPSISMNVSACVTQSWIAWGVGYTKVSTRDHMKLSIPAAWAVCIIMEVVAYFMFGMAA
ncbi:MAG: citrate transporter [Candidatus Fournierella pullistercoris]|uniref:Citrate transporter n=1 Tax=Candidatus Allofournierella pullistercoris TaxID=2838597 RepID=A0A948WQB9_9FIRM|nr:citrate transporter [Candidatus Fournierella pullistercoris]